MSEPEIQKFKDKVFESENDNKSEITLNKRGESSSSNNLQKKNENSNLNSQNDSDIQNNFNNQNSSAHNVNNNNQSSEYNYSKIVKLFLIQKKHKEITDQIHIFKHRVNKYIEPIRSNKHGNSTLSSSLPKIIKVIPQTKIKSTSVVPKFTFQEERQRIELMKENLRLAKEKKQKEAKDHREAVRVVRENALIFKDKINEENRQKKKIISFKHHLMKNSIKNYKIIKKDYVDGLVQNDIDNKLKDIFKKQSELAYLKVTHENNMISLNMKKRVLLSTNKSNPQKNQNFDDHNELESNNKSNRGYNQSNSDGMFLTGVNSNINQVEGEA